MVTSTQDTPTTNERTGPVVPNFREDERVQARYIVMLQRRIKSFGLEHENSIRRNASTKRDELRDELDQAQTEYDIRKEASDAARAEYAKAYPHHVKKLRLDEPSVMENMKSLGAASKLYQAAKDAWHATELATSNLRRIEHNEEQLEIELKKALERAPVVSKEVTESAKWLAEIHAEEDMAAVKVKVDEIVTERAAYAKRLADGSVSNEELRLRTFAAADIKKFPPTIGGMLFERIDTFGPDAYVIVRDLRKQRYSLPYDVRLEPLFDGVYDIVRSGKDVTVRRSTRANSSAALTVLDHFLAGNDDKNEPAQIAYQQHKSFVREIRTYASIAPADEADAAAITLLAEFAQKP